MRRRALSRRVLVEHTNGARKHVSRSKLRHLSPLWRRVPTVLTKRATTRPKQITTSPARAGPQER